MELNEYCMNIKHINKDIEVQAQKRFDNLIKPLSSLGKLEKMVCLYAGAKGTAEPANLDFPGELLCCGKMK